MAAWADAVLFTPVSTGTVDFVVSAVVTGYMTPATAGMVNGRVYKYRAESNDLSQWEIGEGTYTSGTTTLSRTTVLFNSLGTTAKVSFTAAPRVGVVMLKEDVISIEEANTFTVVQQEQARKNIGVMAKGFWSGLQHSNDIVTPNTKIDIAAGACRDSTDTQNITVASGVIDCTTVGANGLDAGALAASTKYYTFAIAKADGTQALLASLSPTTPTFPATYTKFRRIGFFTTDSSSHIIAFTHVNDRWRRNVVTRDIAAFTPTNATNTLKSLASVPNVQGVEVELSIFAFQGSAVSTTVWVGPGFVTQTGGNGQLFSYNTTFGNTGTTMQQVDSSAQVSIYVSSTVAQTVLGDVMSWRDPL